MSFLPPADQLTDEDVFAAADFIDDPDRLRAVETEMETTGKRLLDVDLNIPGLPPPSQTTEQLENEAFERMSRSDIAVLIGDFTQISDHFLKAKRLELFDKLADQMHRTLHESSAQFLSKDLTFTREQRAATLDAIFDISDRRPPIKRGRVLPVKDEFENFTKTEIVQMYMGVLSNRNLSADDRMDNLKKLIAAIRRRL